MDELITPDELAKRWGMSTGTLENWRSSKKKKGPPYIKLMQGRGGSILYRVKDVIAYETKHTIQTKGK